MDNWMSDAIFSIYISKETLAPQCTESTNLILCTVWRSRSNILATCNSRYCTAWQCSCSWRSPWWSCSCCSPGCSVLSSGTVGPGWDREGAALSSSWWLCCRAERGCCSTEPGPSGRAASGWGADSPGQRRSSRCAVSGLVGSWSWSTNVFLESDWLQSTEY